LYMEKKHYILCSSPSKELGEFLESFVSCLGSYQVEFAASLMDAIAKIHAYTPGLFICDPEYLDPGYDQLVNHVFSVLTPEKILLIQPDLQKMTAATDKKFHTLSDISNYAEIGKKIKGLLPLAAKKKKPEYASLLIADDESDLVDLLNDTFGDLGLEIHKAYDGKEALQVMKTGLCNLVILDLRMPNMSGDELIEMIESDPTLKKPKQLIILTASLGSTLNHVKTLGYPVLSKPMEMASIEETILKACKKHHLQLKK